MIKRRFYKLDHGDRDDPSKSSSSSSDFELEADSAEESEGEEAEENQEEKNDNEDEVKVGEKNESSSSSSGYKSEDSSANEVNLDSSGLPTSEDDNGIQNDRQGLMEVHGSAEGNTTSVNVQHNLVPEDGDFQSDIADCVIKCKSVFKCRLCPRIVCLTENTLQAHLKSKRHARSEKLLREGRLKLMLNDDGEIEGETRVEKQASAENSAKAMKKNKRQHRQTNRLKKTKGNNLALDGAKKSSKNPAKKRHRNGD